jgi:glycosyltransferase involved in cell wall biosynthesis
MAQNSEASDYPRVLTIGANPIQRVGSVGITVANLFSGWNKEALAQIYLVDTEPDIELCRKSLRLDEMVFPVDYCIRRLFAKAIKVDHPLTRKNGAVGPSIDDKLRSRVQLHLIARAVSDLAPCILSRPTARWIQEFRPDVIYSCLGNARLMKLALTVSKAAGDVPIVPHFLDDWPDTLYADGRMWGMPRHILECLLKSLLQRAPMGFCIGELMAEEYKTRYGLDFYSFMNCVDDAVFQACPDFGAYRTGPLVWAYVGGLHLNRWKPLALLAQCISAQRGNLKIFAPARDISEHGSHFAGLPNVELGTLAPEDVMESLKESDVLVHVESFDPAESIYTRFSVSTKLAQYLGSGRAVLGFGPEGLASLRLIADAKAGIIVTREDRDELANAVSRIAGDSAFRINCARQSLLYASGHFKKSVVCRRFQQMLELASLAHISV